MNRIRVSTRRWRHVIMLACWFLVTIYSVCAWAQAHYNWVGGAGVQDWGTASNWDPRGIPGVGDTAYLEPNRTNRLASFNNVYPAGTALNLVSVNGLNSGTMTLNLAVGATAGDFRAGSLYLGTTGRGILNQTNGAITVTNYFTLGEQTGSTGTYTISAGTVAANNLVVGEAGNGSLTQSGTTAVTVTNDLGVGQSAGGQGSYTLLSGSLRTNYSFVGHSGTGEFIHSAGEHRADNNLEMGYEAGAKGTYTLSGTGQLNTAYSIVGNLGQGTFNQSGGDHTIAYNLVLGQSTGGSGTYALSGGTVISENAVIGESGNGSFEQSGASTVTVNNLAVGRNDGSTSTYLLKAGTLTINEILSVGAGGTGTFTQAGGTFTVTGDTSIYLAEGETGVGIYNLQVGTLEVQYLDVGSQGTGTFNQSSGTTLKTNGNLMVNSQVGTSVFNQMGGTTTVTGHLGVGRDPNSHAEYNLQSGTLNTGELYVGYEGTGTFKQTGGRHTIINNIYLADYATGRATYNLQGGTFSANNSNPDYGVLNVGGQGIATFNQSLGTTLGVNWLFINSQAGTSVVNQTGGTATVANHLGVGRDPHGHGEYNLQGGSLTAGDLFLGYEGTGTFKQTGGSLTVTGSDWVGHTGTGTFTQSGGSHTVGGDLTLGYEVGGTGNFTLSGAASTLTVNGSMSVGASGTGTFNQSGGSAAIGDSLTLASHTGSHGTCNLSGGTLTVPIINLNAGGVFSQTGGTLNFTTFNQAGGELTTTNIIVGNASPGTFTQSGGSHTLTGSLTLAANPGSSGTYNLQAGTLTAASINVNAGGLFNHTGGILNFTTLNLPGGRYQGNLDTIGTVTGTGTIQGNYTNRGTVSPGNSAGTLNVVGSYTQSASGNYVMEIASPTSYDHVAVTGTATVGGRLTPKLLGGYVPARNQRFADIITATGGVNGTFTVNSPLNWRLLSDTDSIDLLFLGSAYRNFADPRLNLTNNQLQVGLMLNNFAETATGDLATVLGTLTNIPDSQLGRAYQQISPDKASALPTLSLAGSMMQWQSVSNRLSYQRWLQGGMPNLAAGRSGSFNLSYNTLAGLMLAYNGTDLTGLVNAPRMKQESAGNWGVFTDFVSSFGAQNSTVNVTGYNFSIFGVMLGADYRFRDELVIGFGTGYYHTNASYNGSGGHTGINSIPFYAYGAYTPGSFYAMGYLGYTLNLYNLDRNITFGSISRVASGSPNGSQLNASLETGYDLKLPKFTVTPAFTLYYSTAWVDSFTESGAGSLDLKIRSQSADSVQTGLGLRLSRPFQSGTKLLLPQIYAFYQHEFADNSRSLDARLAQSGNTFLFQTESPSRDFALLGAGLAAGLSKNLILQANYSAEVGRSGYLPQVVSAGLRYEF